MRTLILALLLVGSAGAQESPSSATRAANAAVLQQLDFTDRQDFDFAARGFVATLADPVIRAADGSILRDLRDEAQFTGPAPASVNPSLWRNATLLAHHGLFKVAEGIWQIRGFDLSNMTVVAGKTGWIVIDPLTSVEAARAGLGLVDAQLGKRPVVAVIYTHSHADHFGGARGVVDEADVRAGKVVVYAPQGFMAEAASENVIAGNAMARRADYMFGGLLARGPGGLVSSGIGPARAGGTVSLIAPTREVTRADEGGLDIDGVRVEFQLTPGTEAPAEMNLYFPTAHAVLMAENVNASLHNVLTPRGALVRDAKGWADYLTAALRRFGSVSEVMLTSHYWPRWGQAVVADTIARQRDAYKYIHDQSVRLMNDGLTGPEIADTLTLPPVLARAWFNRPNYGSVKFNARAVYQRYMGGFDGNPVSLDPLPRADLARRTVAAMGGAAKVRGLAAKARAAGDERWAAQLLSWAVFADPADTASKVALAGVYDQLAWRAETAPWRNFYLSGAQELRQGVRTTPSSSASLDLARALTPDQLFDSLAVRLVPERAGETPLVLRFAFTDSGEAQLVTIRNGVLIHERDAEGPAQATLRMPKPALLALLARRTTAPELMGKGQLTIEGDPSVAARFGGLFEVPPRDFALVTPPPPPKP